MEVRKSRAAVVVAVLMLAGPPLLLLESVHRLRINIVGVGCLAVFAAPAVGLFVYALRPFRFAIRADGLTLRRRGLNRQVPWSDIETILLEGSVAALSGSQRRSARLLLVPADGVELGVPLTERSPVDRRACLLLLEFSDVRNTLDEVAQALKRFGGDRFVDLRHVAAERFSTEFSIVLRGYDAAAVDRLVADGRQALLSDRLLQRLEVKARIVGASLPIVMRGYDRDQVDAVLAALSAELGIFPADERRPKQRPGEPSVDEQRNE